MACNFVNFFLALWHRRHYHRHTMTPGAPQTALPISRGARWAFTFRIVETGTATPVDLTGLGPFVCEIKDPRRNGLLATPTVTSDYDDTGLITITIEPEDTLALPLGQVRFGVRDVTGNPYIEYMPEVVWFTPTFT